MEIIGALWNFSGMVPGVCLEEDLQCNLTMPYATLLSSLQFIEDSDANMSFTHFGSFMIHVEEKSKQTMIVMNDWMNIFDLIYIFFAVGFCMYTAIQQVLP